MISPVPYFPLRLYGTWVYRHYHQRKGESTVIYKTGFERVLVRLPLDVMEFLNREAERNCASRNSEIVRAIRRRMDSEQARSVG
jgi:hypothetical protein